MSHDYFSRKKLVSKLVPEKLPRLDLNEDHYKQNFLSEKKTKNIQSCVQLFPEQKHDCKDMETNTDLFITPLSVLSNSNNKLRIKTCKARNTSYRVITPISLLLDGISPCRSLEKKRNSFVYLKRFIRNPRNSTGKVPLPIGKEFCRSNLRFKVSNIKFV